MKSGNSHFQEHVEKKDSYVIAQVEGRIGKERKKEESVLSGRLIFYQGQLNGRGDPDYDSVEEN